MKRALLACLLSFPAAAQDIRLESSASGGSSASVIGTTSVCSVGAPGTANSVCLTANTLTAEGATADGFETLFAYGDATGDQTLTCTGAAASMGCVVAAPATAASTTVGNGLAFTASAATAGDTNAGAAAGGAITLTSGAAARLTSGNANGGNIVLATGAGIGTGTAGQVIVPDGVVGAPSIAFSGATTTGIFSSGGVGLVASGTQRANVNANGLYVAPSIFLGANTGALDIGLVRVAANYLRISNASTGLGLLGYGLSVETVATTKTPGMDESAELYTNGADVDGLTITLTNDPTVGTCFEFAIVATVTSGAFTIVANTGETLRDGASVCGTSFNGTALGNTARICAVSGGSGGQWFVMSKNGSWTCTA